MRPNRPRKPRPPLDEASLHELALHYLGRFATTRSKLAAYLRRKIRERGWNGSGEPATEAMIARFAELGLVDDQAFAAARAGSLGRRGYGEMRVKQALQVAGIEEDDRADALRTSRGDAVATALRFARRRRLGPYAETAPIDRKAKDKALAAMLRAGHNMGLSLAILSLEPGTVPDEDELRVKVRHTDE